MLMAILDRAGFSQSLEAAQQILLTDFAQQVQTVSESEGASTFAMIPETAPELPDILSGRPEMAAELRAHLLGFMTSEKVSLSSVKKSKVATHGQGGVGKTTMAVMAINDPMIRQAFHVIGWVSVGQTPTIMELQRVLFHQLTGNLVPTKDGASELSQLNELKRACMGKCLLVVLDDVWNKAHEKLLNCIDPSSNSKRWSPRGSAGFCRAAKKYRST